MVPKLTNIDAAQLSLIPTVSLQSLINSAGQQKASLNTKIAYKTRRKDRLAGIVSVYSPDQGRTSVKSFNSVGDEIMAASKLALPVASLSQTLGALADDTKDVLTNDPLGLGAPVNNANAKVLRDNLSAFNKEIGDLDGNATAKNSDKVILLDAEIGGLRSELAEVNALMTRCNDVITRRAKGEEEEPLVNVGELSNTYKNVADSFKTYVSENIVLPMKANFETFNSFSLSLQGMDTSAPPPIFDLTYGPPVSVKGQFVLSQDGLYYDSRGGGLPVVEGTTLDAEAWELEYAPNLGGKGVFYGDERLGDLKNTVFSQDYISNSEEVAKYYDSDDILENLERNKARQISIVSGQISDLLASGLATHSAMVTNYYSNIGAVAAAYDSKIRKRRKQVQLIALFASDIYSFTEAEIGSPKNLGIGDGILIEYKTTSMESEGFWTPIERVPVNDFTFLKGKPVRLTLEDQRDITLFSEDLDDSILPIVPKFLVSEPQPFSVLDKFSISPTPIGEFPIVDGSSYVSGSGPFVLSLEDRIVTDSLVCAYNFLKPDVVTPSSLEFNLDNKVPDSSGLLDAQLVGSGVDWVFPSGLGIPYFRGTFYNSDQNGAQEDESAQGGSYAVLPTNKDWAGTENIFALSSLNDVGYDTIYDANDVPKGGGFSFDFWVHVPTLNQPSMKDYHRYRLLVANENSGGKLRTYFILPDKIAWYIDPLGQTVKKNRTDRVHGLIMGFREARDFREDTDLTASGIEFIIQPTVSQNQKEGNAAKAWGHSVCLVEDFGETGPEAGTNVVQTADSLTELGVAAQVSSTVNGVTLSDVSSTFMHMCVSFDYQASKLRTMVDGEVWNEVNMASSLMIGYAESLLVPSFANAEGTNPATFEESWTTPLLNGFPYNGPSVNLEGTTFTPWIIGGGFTDGIPSRGIANEPDYIGFLGYNTNDIYYGDSQWGDTGSWEKSQHGRTLNPVTSTRWQSGLNGYMGSFKVYGKALTSTEAKQNFDAQKGFFKNIVT